MKEWWTYRDLGLFLKNDSKDPAEYGRTFVKRYGLQTTVFGKRIIKIHRTEVLKIQQGNNVVPFPARSA